MTKQSKFNKIQQASAVATDVFFGDNAPKALTEEEQKALLEQSEKILKATRGRPKKSEDEKLRGYRYNLSLDKDLKGYLSYISWKNRTSITQYLNDLIRNDMHNYIKNGGSSEEWDNE